MDEDLKNDSQDVQPDTNEQEVTEGESEEQGVTEIAELRKRIEEQEEQIKNLSRFKREAKKAQKTTSKTEDAHSDELGYAEKAYLKASGISPDEFDFIQQERESSGIADLDRLLENGYFKQTLQEFRDKKAVRNASTQNPQRSSGANPQSKAQYWLDKGELPPNTPDNAQLRREVVNARYEQEKRSTRFSSQGVVEG